MKIFNLKTSVFLGTCHCEAVLICLQLLARKRAEMAQPPNNEGLPDKTITDLSNRSISVMPVSKHCCPACNSLVEYYTSTIGKVLYPGGHKNWSACSLPSWILLEAAEHMLKEAKKALGIRLEHLLQKRPPAPPSSSGAKSPDADLSMFTEEASQLAWDNIYSP
ncbi:hypothetical protein K4K56_002994 [Colletotrichum sp. SAR 10_98]|nr:hypothetical protein K4K56_002994 [Colletotrichum sp. SAR 10_98]